MLPAFASTIELAARIPGGIDDDDEARAQAALEDASTLIRVEAGKTWVTGDALDADVPDIIGMVCIAAARRVLINPVGVASESIGDASVTYGDSSGDVYLTSREKSLVRQAAGLRGLTTISTTRLAGGYRDDLGYVDDCGTAYAEVTPDGQPIPWLNRDDLA